MKERVIFALFFVIFNIYKYLIMREKSLDFLGYPNYSVTDDGKVFSLNYNHTGEKKELKQRKDKYGYFGVTLFNENGKKCLLVHRLVALAFIPNTDNLPQVNHKNEIKTDNRVENLEWCDAVYNMNYGTRNKRSAEKQLNRKDKSKPVKQFTKDGLFLKEYQSMKEAARQTGFYKSAIVNCVQGRTKSSYGYIWRYA